MTTHCRPLLTEFTFRLISFRKDCPSRPDTNIDWPEVSKMLSRRRKALHKLSLLGPAITLSPEYRKLYQKALRTSTKDLESLSEKFRWRIHTETDRRQMELDLNRDNVHVVIYMRPQDVGVFVERIWNPAREASKELEKWVWDEEERRAEEMTAKEKRAHPEYRKLLKRLDQAWAEVEWFLKPGGGRCWWASEDNVDFSDYM